MRASSSGPRPKPKKPRPEPTEEERVMMEVARFLLDYYAKHCQNNPPHV